MNKNYCIACGFEVDDAFYLIQMHLCNACFKLQIAKAQAHQQKVYNYQSYGLGGKSVAYKRGSSYQTQSTYPVTSSRTNTQCSFTWDVARGAYGVKSDFNPNFIEFIKAKVPGSDRAADYDPVTRKFNCWYIKEAWFDILHELATQLWPGGVTVLSRVDAERAYKEQETARAQALAAQRAAVLGPFEAALLDFFACCDLESLKACYRKAATSLHPDKAGGDSDKMARLNAAWFLIEQEFKKRSEAK